VASTTTTIHPGRATRCHRFNPSQGLGRRLRDLIATVAPGDGVEFTDDVGVTSHAGDCSAGRSSPAAGYASAALR
jgi:hypothetical protein